MGHFALYAIGKDRPGIVAALCERLLTHGANIEDSQMTILRGHFTMILICGAPADLDSEALLGDLLETARELGLEWIYANEIAELEPPPPAASHLVTVYGADHPGIVHAVSSALAGSEVNITDLNTRLVGGDGEQGLYVMMLEVLLPASVSPEAVEQALGAVAAEQGVDVSFRELEQDAL